MSPLEAILPAVAIAVPFLWLVQRELDRLCDPAWLRGQGIVIVRESVLEAHSAPIGEYLGHDVWETVTFLGTVYRFDRVVPRSRREHLGPRELFLDPGLVYVASPA